LKAEVLLAPKPACYPARVQGVDVIASSGSRAQPRGRSWLLPLASLVLLAAGGAGSALLYQRSLRAPHAIPGLMLGSARLGALDAPQLDAVIADEAVQFLEQPLQLQFGLPAAPSAARGTELAQFGATTIAVRRSALGARVNAAETRALALAAGKSGDLLRDLVDRVQARRGRLRVPLVAELDRDVALDFFTRLRAEVDRPPVAARLDLDRATVVPATPGRELQVYDSMAATELALGAGRSSVRLAIAVRDAPGADGSLARLEIGHVLGRFTTVYSLADKDADRAHNLKVGASKLDGAVIRPGASFSFNQRVGKRTEKEGYRTAPVITEGELVDGMAGGACQLSSTLFAAAFFAGLELESSRPHTRPSSYIKMGLDAAVAYPATDLVLKNPYPFPVVIHYKVNQGKVTVRILGSARPWRRVVFERVVKETTPFQTVVKSSATIPRGQRIVSQVGVPGFRIERRRYFYHGAGGEPARVEKREVRYPPTTQFVHEGTGPRSAGWKRPPEPAPFGEVPPSYRMEQ
jgi:vancomycin resistance protein YoaR